MSSAVTRARAWPSRLVPLLPIALALLGLLAVYGPVLRIGPVAEDFQIALKGIKILSDPGELLRPFQLVWRPLAYLPFTALFAVFGSTWAWYRAVQIALACALAVAGWTVLRRIAGFGPWLAAGLAGLWLLSPLSDEVVCGETSLLGHELFGVAVLAALTLRQGPRIRGGGVLLIGAVTAALLAKEEAVVLPAVFLVQDLALGGVPWRRAVRSALGWSGLVAAQLLTYGAITHFAYRGFYAAAPVTMIAKALLTSASFFHLIAPVPWRFGEALGRHALAAMGGGALLVAMTVWLAVRRERRGLFFLAVAAFLLAPTLPSDGQSGRWTFLPWLFFLAAVAAAAAELRRVLRLPRLLDGAFCVLAAAIFVGDTAAVRGDVADWERFAGLTGRLEREAMPLLTAGRRGDTVVALRGRDGGPLRELLLSPAGDTKFYFPRPDDPYGVVSLSALLSWHAFREGFVLERVETLPREGAAVAFVHDDGGFRRLAVVPRVEVRHPDHPGRGVPGVILRPRAWASFRPVAFP